jgi:predicted acetyltransferase
VTRAGRHDDWDGLGRLLSSAFLTDGVPFAGADHGVFEPARSLVVTDGQDLVAHTGAYTRELSVPGATLPAAHVALVAVEPTYRRRGVMSLLMRRQLADVQEALAVLFASEGRIYHRFGYGLATSRLNVAADLREIRPPGPEPDGYRLHEEEPPRALASMREVYERVWAGRTGWSDRSDPWWRWVAGDPPERRSGTPRRVLLAEGPTGAEGYAVWRASGDWDDAGPAGTVELLEFVAETPAAATVLWRFLLSVDLTRCLRFPLAAVDDPLVHLIDEPRRLHATLADALWVRLADVPAALSGRRYLVPLDVVIAVRDPLLPGNSGTWRLCGDQTGATCTATRADPDLTLDVRDLGAAYLGGVSLMTLAAAGRVGELRTGALSLASKAFGWYRQPSVAEMF